MPFKKKYISTIQQKRELWRGPVMLFVFVFGKKSCFSFQLNLFESFKIICLGIVPMFAELLYKEIDNKKDSGITFETRFTMLEIYNEDARDLLAPKQKKGGLKIRQHPKKGFYGDYMLIFYLFGFLPSSQYQTSLNCVNHVHRHRLQESGTFWSKLQYILSQI